MKDTPGYHETRLSFDARREVLWETLCEAFFQHLVPPVACVLELGAGYGHFINHIRCQSRIAVDKWPGFARYVNSDVIAHVGEVTDLSFIAEIGGFRFCKQPGRAPDTG